MRVSLQKYIDDSFLLLSARPTSTHISLSYNTNRKTGHGRFIAKTYDPVSGTCLRIKLNKSNEVSRVINSLGDVMTQQMIGKDASNSEYLSKNFPTVTTSTSNGSEDKNTQQDNTNDVEMVDANVNNKPSQQKNKSNSKNKKKSKKR